MRLISARVKWFQCALVLVLLLSGNAQRVSGQGTPTSEVAPQSSEVVFGVYPVGTNEGVYFEAVVDPGSTHEFELALVNGGASELGLLAYPADVYSMTNGGMGVNFQDQGRTEPTSWINFEEGVVQVAAGEEEHTLFTVTVPDGTAPGQYVTAIAVETADSFAVGDEGGAFRQVLRKVVAVVILVPGEAEPSFVIGTPEVIVSEGQSVLRVPIENTGNIRVRPTGPVILADSEGKEIATGDVAMGSVYMGDTAPIEIWMPNALPVGDYLVSAELADPDTGVSASIKDVSVTVVPAATPEPVAAATPVVGPVATPVQVEPVTLQSVEITENADPIQFSSVKFDIENSGNHIARARVTLSVSHDGETVEEFVIDDNLPLPVGTTSVEDRYIPPAGWEPGTWTFSVTIHSVNTNENVETVVVSEADIATINVP